MGSLQQPGLFLTPQSGSETHLGSGKTGLSELTSSAECSGPCKLLMQRDHMAATRPAGGQQIPNMLMAAVQCLGEPRTQGAGPGDTVNGSIWPQALQPLLSRLLTFEQDLNLDQACSGHLRPRGPSLAQLMSNCGNNINATKFLAAGLPFRQLLATRESRESVSPHPTDVTPDPRKEREVWGSPGDLVGSHCAIHETQRCKDAQEPTGQSRPTLEPWGPRTLPPHSCQGCWCRRDCHALSPLRPRQKPTDRAQHGGHGGRWRTTFRRPLGAWRTDLVGHSSLPETVRSKFRRHETHHH
ncbi:hypothetical protein D623_10024924 [Myotis brandtii]|uniref:Uncharacterized protein n=1 Tax=Myotis brandtii TaxID=109478 RepID=S7Q5J8_MYOBR|nr:hypothetical protein D623_10024924 [Myotis brandtii]